MLGEEVWFENVDFPQPLVDAHSEGSLVLFVGAGASMNPPSQLPDFDVLAKEIVDAAHQRVPKDIAKPDARLGWLAEQGVDVHQQVANRILGSSQPNQLHQDIAALADAAPEVRVVTTNYDLHLTRALNSLGADFEEFRGPALPLGNDFKGLVYLHGNVRQCPRHLVVTDENFGVAYLREAWATRFLERMFTEYTVLFIGVSHKDTMMSYIGRALVRVNDRRYALVGDERLDRGRWKQLGVGLVTYQIVNGSRNLLTRSIRRWADQASMGLTAHRERIRELVSLEPPQEPEDVSYMEETIRDPARVRFFVEYARSVEWLRWADERDLLQQVLSSAGSSVQSYLDWMETDSASPESTERDLRDWLQVTEILAEWFAEHYALHPDHSAEALAMVKGSGREVGQLLWGFLNRRIFAVDDVLPDWANPWVVLLIESASDNDLEDLSRRISRLQWPEDRSPALLLFDSLTEPRGAVMSSSRYGRYFRGKEYWLSKAWDALFKPNLEEAAPEVLAIVDRHIRRAYHLLAATNRGHHGWDPISWDRSAIETHEQDSLRTDLDVLVDAARDCLEAMLVSDRGVADLYLSTWANSSIPVLRRLAVHGCAGPKGGTDEHGTAKVRWLLSRGWLYDRQIWHETFRLLRKALPTTSVDMADELVQCARAGPPDVEEGALREHERYLMLGWIVQCAPHLEKARAEFDLIQAAHPTWELGKHPDFRHSHRVGDFKRPSFPISLAGLHDHIVTDPEAAVRELLAYENQTSVWEGPTWENALQRLAETVEQYPEDGLAVLATPQGAEHPDIAKQVVYGWFRGSVDVEAADQIATKLSQFDLHLVKVEVADMLLHGGTAWHTSQVARQLARTLWATLENEGDKLTKDGRVLHPRSHPVGKLALYWINAIAVDWREAGEKWEGLSPTMQATLKTMLEGSDQRIAIAEAVLASDLQFLFEADSEWCRNNVMPLFDWDSPDRAKRAWDGFLTWGRFNDHLLDAGLLTMCIDAAARRTDQLSPEAGERLYQHLAVIALVGGPDQMSWISEFTAQVADETLREKWIRNVAQQMSRLPDGAVELQWNRWMGGVLAAACRRPAEEVDGNRGISDGNLGGGVGPPRVHQGWGFSRYVPASPPSRRHRRVGKTS